MGNAIRARLPTIGIIGPYPPPYGGRSVHIKRLIHHIQHENYEILVFDDTKKRTIEVSEKIIIFPFAGRLRVVSNLIKMLFFVDIIHCQGPIFLVGNWLLIAIMGFLSILRKRVIVSLHWSVNDLKRGYEQSSSLKRWIIRFVLFRANCVIATNDEVKSYILKLAGKRENSPKIVIVPSFIPPNEKDEEYNVVPNSVCNFIFKHKPVIGLNVSYIRIAEGIDVYGLDMAVELINRLKDKWPNIGLIVLLPNVNNLNYLSEIKQRIKDNHLGNNILINTTSIEAYPVWKRVSLFIRPTSWDTTAISMWEALFFKVPAVASDCVNRPKGVVTFECRNVDSLVEKTEIVFQNYREYKKKLDLMTIPNNAKEILRLYDHALHL